MRGDDVMVGSDFTKYHTNPKFGKFKHTMRSKKTMHGHKIKAKEIYIGPSKAHKFFRRSNVNMDRDFHFDIRRIDMRSKLQFKRRRLKGPRGIVFESDGIIHAIYEKYGESSRKRDATRGAKTRSKKMKESRLKKESHKTSIRAEARKKRGYRKSKPKKTEPIPDEDIFWEEEIPTVVDPLTFKAQCYSCYGMMDVPYDDEPVILSCPSCGAKNMFRDSPKPKKEVVEEEEEEVWFVTDEKTSYDEKVDEKAVSMNEYGKKLLDQGFYKAAIYWFDQALSQDANYKAAKKNRDQAQQMLDGQTNIEFRF
jgi:hypothetical protein